MKSESFIYFEMQIRLMKEVIEMEVKLWLKGEFESWDEAKEMIVHGKEITRRECEEFFEFVEQLLEKTYYSDFVVTRIYKTIEKGFVIKLFKQTENQYGGYAGTIETYVTINDIVKNIKGC
jgi:hypothetical protein